MSAGEHDARLELAYRRLLLAYPADYRNERGDELVSTLLASAPPGRRRPSIAEAFDLLYHGFRTRARLTRRTLTGPAAADELVQAAVVSLTVAAAVAVAVIVGVSLLGQPVFYRHPESSYPAPVRAGVGLVLTTFPAALAFLSGNRARVARRLAALGALGSIGFAAWLSVHAVHIQNERIATLDDMMYGIPSVPDETLEPSNLFGLVTLLCVPAVLLVVTRSTSDHRRRVGHRAAFAGLLGAAFIALTTTDLAARATPSSAGAGRDQHGPSAVTPRHGPHPGHRGRAHRGSRLARRPPTSVPKPDGRFRHDAAGTGLCHRNPRHPHGLPPRLVEDREPRTQPARGRLRRRGRRDVRGAGHCLGAPTAERATGGVWRELQAPPEPGLIHSGSKTVNRPEGCPHRTTSPASTCTGEPLG
jgi:hypothetical protein